MDPIAQYLKRQPIPDCFKADRVPVEVQRRYPDVVQDRSSDALEDLTRSVAQVKVGHAQIARLGKVQTNALYRRAIEVVDSVSQRVGYGALLRKPGEVFSEQLSNVQAVNTALGMLIDYSQQRTNEARKGLMMLLDKEVQGLERKASVSKKLDPVIDQYTSLSGKLESLDKEVDPQSYRRVNEQLIDCHVQLIRMRGELGRTQSSVRDYEVSFQVNKTNLAIGETVLGFATHMHETVERYEDILHQTMQIWPPIYTISAAVHTVGQGLENVRDSHKMVTDQYVHGVRRVPGAVEGLDRGNVLRECLSNLNGVYGELAKSESQIMHVR